jgi:DNA-directed RNA polymerase specialized sigma24 family protein
VTDVGRAIEDALFSAESTTSGIELELLIRALGRLKLKKRQAFVLMAILDYSAAEAGEILHISANTAASRCRHARQELLDHMERHDRS